MAADTAETSSATPSAAPPPSTSVGANVVAYEISGDSTQKLPGQSPNNAAMAADTETSTATPSAAPPPPTSVGANVVAYGITGDSTQKLPEQSPNNPKVAADTAETSTATTSADLAPPMPVSPPLAEPAISGASLDSSQGNPNVQGDKPDLEPESDQGDGFTDPKTPKYKVGTFIITKMDNICCTGIIPLQTQNICSPSLHSRTERV
jgi:hypothetical protein